MPTRWNRGFYCRSYCLLNMFRVPLCPPSGAQEYYTGVAACGISCCGFQVAGLVWSWGLCVRFAGCCSNFTMWALLWKPGRPENVAQLRAHILKLCRALSEDLCRKSCDECKGSFARGCEAKRWSHWTCSSLRTIFQPIRINSVPDVKCFCNNKNVLRAQSMVWHFVRHPLCVLCTIFLKFYC